MAVKIVLAGESDYIRNFLKLAIGAKLPLNLVVLPDDEADVESLQGIITASQVVDQIDISMGATADFSDSKIAIIFQRNLPENVKLESFPNELEVLQKNLPKFRQRINEAIENGFGGKFIISGFLDEILTYFAWRFSGMDKTSIIGAGAYPQSLLLQSLIQDQLVVGKQDVNVSVVGRASEPLIAWSRTYVGPTPLLMYLANDDSNFSAQDLAALEAETTAIDLINNQTLQGLAVMDILRAITLKKSAIMSVSNIQEAENPSDSFASSTPVLVDHRGVTKLTDLTLSENEQSQYEQIEMKIKTLINTIENGGLETKVDEN